MNGYSPDFGLGRPGADRRRQHDFRCRNSLLSGVDVRDNRRRIPADNCICRDALRHDRARLDDGSATDDDARQHGYVHADRCKVADDDLARLAKTGSGCAGWFATDDGARPDRDALFDLDATAQLRAGVHDDVVFQAHRPSQHGVLVQDALSADRYSRCVPDVSEYLGTVAEALSLQTRTRVDESAHDTTAMIAWSSLPSRGGSHRDSC